MLTSKTDLTNIPSHAPHQDQFTLNTFQRLRLHMRAMLDFVEECI